MTEQRSDSADCDATCGCPTNEAGDIRCHRCGEYVNRRCWNCGTPRGGEKCPNPIYVTTPAGGDR